MIKDVTKFPGVISFIQGDIDYEDLPKSTKEALYEYYVFEFLPGHFREPDSDAT